MDDVRVLIVDDSALMRSLIGKIVDGTPGLTVADKAMNGRFALQKLERVQPDIIVLDLEMPEMNGIEFLRERKRLGIDIPVSQRKVRGLRWIVLNSVQAISLRNLPDLNRRIWLLLQTIW